MKSKGLETFQRRDRKSLVTPGVSVTVTDECGIPNDPNTFVLTDLQESVGTDGTITVRDKITAIINQITPGRKFTGAKEGHQGPVVIVRCPQDGQIHKMEFLGDEGWWFFVELGTGENESVYLRRDKGNASFTTKKEIIDTLATNNFDVSK